MELDFYTTITAVAIMILVSACSSKLASWINMPSLILFLLLGMLAGSEGIGKIDFNNATYANGIGSIAMAFILFSGGYDTSWKSVKSVLGVGGVLSSLGVLLTAIFVGVFAYFLLGWAMPGCNISLSWCLLLGAIISSTDAAAVFSILRSQKVSVQKRLKSLLEFESGSNDPMAALLTIFMVGIVSLEYQSGVITPIRDYITVIPEFFIRMTLGVLTGILCGRGAVWIFNKINLEYDGLYFVMATGVILFVFGFTYLIKGNNFMAVYAAGITMGNSKFIYCNGVGRYCDGLAWLMQVVLFGMLGLLAYPSKVIEVLPVGLIIAGFLMVVARPLAVFLCMIGSKFSLKGKLFISWVGLRGGAPIMLATFPMIKKIEYNDIMFHIVFCIVFISVALQGFTIMPLARYFHLDLPLPDPTRVPLQLEDTGNLDSVTRDFTIDADSEFAGKKLAEFGLPQGALVLLIKRNKKFLVPQGNTEIKGGDSLMVIGTPRLLGDVGEMLGIGEEEY